MFWVLQWAQSAGTTVQRGFRHLTHWLHNDFAQINHPLMRSANIDGYVTLLQLVLQGPNKNTVCVYARACRSVFANRKPVPERVNFFFIRFPISYSFLIHFLFSVIYGSVCFFATLPLSPPWLRPSVYRHPCQILFLPRSYFSRRWYLYSLNACSMLLLCLHFYHDGQNDKSHHSSSVHYMPAVGSHPLPKLPHLILKILWSELYYLCQLRKLKFEKTEI